MPYEANNLISTAEIGERNRFFYYLSACLLLLIAVAALAANEIYRPHVTFKDAKAVEIPPGIGSRKIAEFLKREGVIRSKWVFVIYISLKGKASALRPGDYLFARETIPEIMRDLIQGGTNERIITIPEGWSTKDIANYFEREGVATRDELLKITSGQHWELTTEKFDFLKDRPKDAGLEGYLFPDTYRIFKSAGLEEIIVKMLENFGRKITPELLTEITRQNKTLFEIITLASLIEKEVTTEEDRALVSGILWKRLSIGVGLQVDATIIYITGKKSTRVSREETQIDSPFNTYKYRGLPKGPISNPGLSSIRAAIYPKESPYLYYLSATDGKTIFSRTLEAHNTAKAKYLK